MSIMATPVFKAYLLVRDSNGVPRIDDPENMPGELKDALTNDDLQRMDREIVERLGLAHKLEN